MAFASASKRVFRCKLIHDTKTCNPYRSSVKQIKIIFIWKILHEDWFWKRDTRSLGNGLFILLHFTFISYLLFSFLTAFGIECYSCTNQPFISGGATCGSGKAQKITCAPLVFNRCMTMKYTQYLGQLAGSTLVELRNCSNIPSCDPDSQYNSKCANSYFLVENAR